eukprot:1176075-Prorocentrum_minimum.AAC.1
MDAMRSYANLFQVTTLAGCGSRGHQDDHVDGYLAQFWNPHGICVAPSGDVYVADTGNHRIRKVTPDGKVRHCPLAQELRLAPNASSTSIHPSIPAPNTHLYRCYMGHAHNLQTITAKYHTGEVRTLDTAIRQSTTFLPLTTTSARPSLTLNSIARYTTTLYKITSFYGSSCANNGKGALNTPDYIYIYTRNDDRSTAGVQPPIVVYTCWPHATGSHSRYIPAGLTRLAPPGVHPRWLPRPGVPRRGVAAGSVQLPDGNLRGRKRESFRRRHVQPPHPEDHPQGVGVHPGGLRARG